MLDADLARLYHVTTFNLNKAVARNRDRFPVDFMFQLTKQEFVVVTNLIFQNGISSSAASTHGGRRHLPYVFTQEGVAMLSGILQSSHAVAINILIMRTFVRLRATAIGYAELAQRINELESTTDKQFIRVFDALRELLKDTSTLQQEIGLPKPRRQGKRN